jgi:hypothetical protein
MVVSTFDTLRSCSTVQGTNWAYNFGVVDALEP